jgi:hypothetical protein
MEDRWIVVCTDLHYAVGIFDAEKAVDTARKLTQQGQCVFMPVKCGIMPEEDESPEYRGGQYL